MAAESLAEPLREGTPSSLESSPEPEAGAEASTEQPQPQKRKGGRKPVCFIKTDAKPALSWSSNTA